MRQSGTERWTGLQWLLGYVSPSYLYVTQSLSSTLQQNYTLQYSQMLTHSASFTRFSFTINQSIMTRSDHPEPPVIAIVRQNGLSSASSRASVADTPVSWQIWWTQVVDGRPQVRLHSCEGCSPSLVLAQILRIEFAGTSLRSLGDMTIEAQSSYTDDVWDVEQASTLQNFVVPSFTGGLQIQPNKFPRDFQDIFNKVPTGFLHWLSLLHVSITTWDTNSPTHVLSVMYDIMNKTAQKWPNNKFLQFKDGSVIAILSHFSWQLHFAGASVKFQEISKISRSCRHHFMKPFSTEKMNQ